MQQDKYFTAIGKRKPELFEAAVNKLRQINQELWQIRNCIRFFK